MAKMKSTFINMLLSLTLIALVAAGLLAGANELTKDTIKKTEAKNVAEAKLKVLPKMDSLKVAEVGDTINGNIIIYRATANGEEIGAAIEINGNKFGGNTTFGGDLSLMIGFTQEGEVTGFKVLKQQETPGLGAKMGDWFANTKNEKACVIGKNPGTTTFKVSKDDKEGIDAITAATITSRAFLSAVQDAYNAYTQVEATEADAESGATTIEGNNENVQPESEENPNNGK